MLVGLQVALEEVLKVVEQDLATQPEDSAHDPRTHWVVWGDKDQGHVPCSAPVADYQRRNHKATDQNVQKGQAVGVDCVGCPSQHAVR